MKIYLDVCCLNRPFDDQSQERVRLEAEAVLLILRQARIEGWVWYSSDVVSDEVDQTPDSERRGRVRQLIAYADVVHRLSDADIARARVLAGLGLTNMDALHLACAEGCGAEIFLTTDDRLLSRAGRMADLLRVAVDNPLPWLLRRQASETK